jgi:hypothetical protein
MGLDNLRDAEFLEMCSNFPLTPIEDGASYRAVLEILDHLFARDEPRTPAESEFFRTLAELASEYELRIKGTGDEPGSHDRQRVSAIAAQRWMSPGHSY